MRERTPWALALTLAPALIAVAAGAGETRSLGGELTVGVEGLSLRDAGAVVVFLEPEGSAPRVETVGLAPAQVRQHGGRFVPPFLAVAVGQPVEMPNDDVIYHNVFSYSEPNDFDLGLYPAGKSRSLRFEHAGLVRIYCSIHEAMDGLIFVAPSRLFGVPDADGHYAIQGVPAGRYRLRVWSERLPESVRTVEIAEPGPAQLDLELGLASR